MLLFLTPNRQCQSTENNSRGREMGGKPAYRRSCGNGRLFEMMCIRGMNGFWNISDVFPLGKDCDSTVDTVITQLSSDSAVGNVITKLSLAVLKPGGKLLARVSVLPILQMFERLIIWPNGCLCYCWRDSVWNLLYEAFYYVCEASTSQITGSLWY